jgi:hypothetical protein
MVIKINIMAITITKKKQLEVIGRIPTKEHFALSMITKGHTMSVLTKQRGEKLSMTKKVKIHVGEMQQKDGSAETWNWKGSVDGKRSHGFLRSGKTLIITLDE